MTTAASALATSPQEALDTIANKLGGETPALVVIFASPAHPLEAVVGLAKKRYPNACVLGASSAGEFNESGDAKKAISVFAIAGDIKTFQGFGRGLKADAEKAVGAALKDLPREVSGYPHATAILLLDALSGVGEEASLLVGVELGPNVKLAGGAAGDDLSMTRTLVASGMNVDSDALAIGLLFTKQPLGVGVSHGHQPISEPLAVTSAEGSVVRTIESRPAWDVWKEKTREVAKARGIDVDAIKPGDEGAYLLRYEAGLALGGEAEEDRYKIRAPLSVGENGSLSFACGIPGGSMIRITESVAERQVESAVRAARFARADIGGAKVAGAIIFDCICRNLILRSEFQAAVKGMAAEFGDAPLAGFETYGEIALNSGDMSGFHNTTTVALVFPDLL